MKLRTILLLLIASISFVTFAQQDYSKPEFVKGPYIMFGKNAGDMRIMWQLRRSYTAVIRRSDGSCDFVDFDTISESNKEHLYIYDYKNLPKGSRSIYEIQVGLETVNGGFYTRPDDTLSKFSFFAYGDTRSKPVDHNKVCGQIMNQISKNYRLHSFILSTGDLVANGNKEEDWSEQFFNRNYINTSNLLASMPYMTSMGNHEGQGKLFAKYFPYEFFENERYYYTFNYGIAQFIAIDQFTNIKPNSAQYKWLENELKNSKSKWKIIMLHKPGYTAGGHRNNKKVSKYLQPLFKKYNVKLVLGGHNHYYARATVDGITHITTGGGGAPLYTPKKKEYIDTIDKSNHFLLIEVNKNKLTLKAIRADGSIIEKIIINQ